MIILNYLYIFHIYSILILGGIMITFWIIIILILSFIEASTVGLTTIWFVISGLFSLLLAALNVVGFEVQFAVFVIGGLIALIITRPLLKKFIAVKPAKTNLDRIIGMYGVVTKEIDANRIGEVKVDGKLWSAYADKQIKIHKTVKVLEINGVKIKVEEEEE